jgi:hypothetical protein
MGTSPAEVENSLALRGSISRTASHRIRNVSSCPQVRVRFAQYFHIIADAFRASTDSSPTNPLTAMSPPSEADLASAAAALPPALVVLSVGCDLVQLLPLGSVKEIVPASLVEAISAVVTDEVLASCVTGLRAEVCVCAFSRQWLF